jgi:hypothetical protein
MGDVQKPQIHHFFMSSVYIEKKERTIHCGLSFNININLEIRLIITLIIPRDKTKPPKTNSKRSTNDPKVLATTMFLPTAAMVRNNPEAI